MTRQEKWRLLGTAVLAVATAVTYSTGILAAWYYLFQKLPLILGVCAIAGCAISPFVLVKDLLDEQRKFLKTAEEKKKEDEALD